MKFKIDQTLTNTVKSLKKHREMMQLLTNSAHYYCISRRTSKTKEDTSSQWTTLTRVDSEVGKSGNFRSCAKMGASLQRPLRTKDRRPFPAKFVSQRIISLCFLIDFTVFVIFWSILNFVLYSPKAGASRVTDDVAFPLFPTWESTLASGPFQ